MPLLAAGIQQAHLLELFTNRLVVILQAQGRAQQRHTL